MQFRGEAIITDDINLVQQSQSIPGTKIINLDSDTRFSNPDVIGGGLLLPPPDAMMAMVDGDEQRFDIIYNAHYETPELSEYMVIIFGFLFNTGNLIFYHPDLHATDNTMITKFLNIMYDKFGLGIGIPGQVVCQYDARHIVQWLNMLYSILLITPPYFLREYPVGIQIDPQIMGMLLQDMKLLDITQEDKEKHIYDLVKKYKEKPNLVVPVHSII